MSDTRSGQTDPDLGSRREVPSQAECRWSVLSDFSYTSNSQALSRGGGMLGVIRGVLAEW